MAKKIQNISLQQVDDDDEVTLIYNMVYNAGSGTWVKMQQPMLYNAGDLYVALDDVEALLTDIESAVEIATPTIYNVTMTSADTEYSQAIPANTRRLTIQCQGAYDIRFAFASGKVATPTAPYGTIKKGMNYYEENLKTSGLTVYVACGTTSQVAEIYCWS